MASSTLTPTFPVGLYRQIFEDRTVPDGLRRILQSLTFLGSVARGCFVVFRGERAPAQLFEVDGCATTPVLERPISNADAILQWTKAHPEPYLLPSENTTFVPAALRGLPIPGVPYHVVVPLMICDRVHGLALLAIHDSERWKRSHLSAVRDLRVLWGAWLEGLFLRERESTADDNLRTQIDYLRGSIRAERGLRFLAGQSDVMKSVRRAIRQVAATDSTVLLIGEAGTGKDVVARAIHQASARHRQLLVSVNSASLAPAQVASELFGFEAGAFNGATKSRAGRFELAHRGTLFLDGVADIPLPWQQSLLRTLKDRTIERVGSCKPIPVDVRLIAGSRRPLDSAVATGVFRSDLFYHLNVFPIRVPPLRERLEDIPDLARHFACHFARKMNRSMPHIPVDSLAALNSHHWPGNVRELENCIERAVMTSDGEQLRIDAGWFTTRRHESSPLHQPNHITATWEERERHTLLDALRATNGRVYGPKGAAARLGLKPTTFYGKLRRFGIRNPKNRHPV